MNRSLSTLVLLAAAFIAGCASQPGKPVVAYNAGKDVPCTFIAHSAWHFSLYADDINLPLYSVDVLPADEVGFVQRGDGSVVGVAKGVDIPLTSANAK